MVDQSALDLMPSGITPNYIFQGKGELAFEDQSKKWIPQDAVVSGATAWADLDNDGDLDLVSNNLNSSPTLYRNTTDDKAKAVTLSFSYKDDNPLGIGTKVFSYHNGIQQYKELYTVRGFQASSQPVIHLGFGSIEQVDSIRVVWPDRTYQTLKNIATDQQLTVEYGQTKPFNYEALATDSTPLFEEVSEDWNLDYVHEEDPYIDFNRQKLIPYQISDRGPAMAIGDLNGDGRDDIFFGSSKFKTSRVYIQGDTSFAASQNPFWKQRDIAEDVSAVISDFDGNGSQELYVGTGGGDFYKDVPALQDRKIVLRDSLGTEILQKDIYTNTSVLAPYDYDGDGDLDLFIGNQAITNDFGALPTSYFLKNENGDFSIDSKNPPVQLGMITDAIWDDVDRDGAADLIVVGEWMAPKILKNTLGALELVEELPSGLRGLWQSIAPFDIDHDGDSDYILGNWGLNSKFVASSDAPMRMYYGDFDNNDQTETIVTTNKNGNYYPIVSFDELTSQLVFLKKRFTTYRDFAGKEIRDIFEKELLTESAVLEVDILASGYLRNDEGQFVFVPFETDLQLAPITAFCVYDFDGDGEMEALAAGNYFGVKPYHGRLGTFSGALIESPTTTVPGYQIGLDMEQRSARHLNIINVGEHPYLLATFNNDKVQLYKLLNK